MSSLYPANGQSWAPSSHPSPPSQLERDFMQNQGQTYSHFPVQMGYQQHQHQQQRPTLQRPPQPAFDQNLWPQRSQSINTGIHPQPNPSGVPPRPNAMLTYQGFAQQQLFNNPPQPYSQPHHMPQQTMFQGNQDAGSPFPPTLTPGTLPLTSPAATQTSLPGSSHASPITLPVTQGFFQHPSSSPEIARKDSTNKRVRLSGPDLSRDDEGDSDDMGYHDGQDASRSKPTGACARCKELKVKCEFRTETDPCRRCLNAGRECVIPGRKKRRTPPKREYLLNQIREQAEQIQKLMAKLEESNGLASGTSDAFLLPPGSRSSTSLHSPILSPGSAHPSTMSPLSGTTKGVEDWISKARESFADFGGFIGLGGTNVPKNYLVEKDLEDPSSSDDDFEHVDADGGDRRDDADFSIAVLNDEGKESQDWLSPDPKGKDPRLSRPSSNSSLHAKHRKDEAKLATLPSEAVPYGLMAGLSLKNHRSMSQHTADEMDDDEAPKQQLGVASADFFRHSPEPERPAGVQKTVTLPHILTRNIITTEEAEKLFKIYFDKINCSVSLLDPVIYTAQKTCFRSPFLFTVICAIASRFYLERLDLYAQAMHYAQLAAGTSLLSGPKSVEMCHGYLLLALYPVPARRYEEDRSWVFLGLAIRIAIDLNLHIPVTAEPKNESHAREILNRTRCYLNLFNVDRSMGSQYGKHAMLPNSDYVACHSTNWWKSSPYNMKNFDIQLCCYSEELMLIAKFRGKIYSDPEHPTGLNKDIDFETLCKDTDDELQRVKAKWIPLIEETTDMSDMQNRFRTGLLHLAFSYARLAVLSFGFQHAFDKNHADEMLLRRCLTAAKDVVNVVLTDIGRPETRIYLRHGPDAQRVFVTFASAFLVKLLQPKFSNFLPVEERLEIRRLVKQVADLLGSPEIAVDDRHGPKLFSRFLKGLLATPMAKVHAEPKHVQEHARQYGSIGSPGTLASSTYSSPSPEAGLLSPAPSQAAMSFDQFADNAPLDPFAPHHIEQHVPVPSPDAHMNMNAFFSPPLPFDHEILSSMQSLTDPVWQENIMPGFQWMSTYQSNTDAGLGQPSQQEQNFSEFYQ